MLLLSFSYNRFSVDLLYTAGPTVTTVLLVGYSISTLQSTVVPYKLLRVSLFFKDTD